MDVALHTLKWHASLQMRSMFGKKERVPQLEGAPSGGLPEDKPEEEEDPTPPIERMGAVHGWVYKRGKLKSRAWRRRYAVYEPASHYFTYYDSQENATADTKRKGRTRVTQSSAVRVCPPTRTLSLSLATATHLSSATPQAGPACVCHLAMYRTRSGTLSICPFLHLRNLPITQLAGAPHSLPALAHAQTNKSAAREAVEQRMAGKTGSNKDENRFEFRFNTSEGRVFDCYTLTEEEQKMWLEAMPHWTASLVMGWLQKRKLGAKSKSWDPRYVIFDPETNIFSYYKTEQDAKMDRDRRGAVEVESTVLYPDKFAFYTTTGRFFECMAETPDVRPCPLPPF